MSFVYFSIKKVCYYIYNYINNICNVLINKSVYIILYINIYLLYFKKNKYIEKIILKISKKHLNKIIK